MKSSWVTAVKARYLIPLVLILLLFMLFAFFPFGSSANPVAIQKTMDGGHAFAFFLLSGLLYLVIEQRSKGWAVLISAILSVAMMVMVELLQPYVGRTASLADFMIGLLGVIIALTGVVVWRHMNRWMLRVVHLVIAVVAVVWVVQPALDEWRALWLRGQQFPLLGDFEDRLEKRLWKASGEVDGERTRISFSEKHTVSGASSLKIETVGGTWSGVSYAAGDQDWRDYRMLVIEAYNPGDAFAINIRIDDGVKNFPQYGERYNGQWQINAGANTLSIPLAKISLEPRVRPLELERIRKMILFVGKGETPLEFYLDNVRLVP